jgi:GH15 family glucan-1,4-alpha-glucosidase
MESKHDLFKTAYSEALKVLDACVRDVGFYASGLPGGYEAIWARDSMITSLGASLVENRYKVAIARSLHTMAKWQSKNGQIPNCVGSYNKDRRSDKTYNSIDSSLWYIIGHYAYANAYGSNSLIKQHRHSIARALVWLRYQDPNEDGLLSQQPTMDWQDAFPHKYGNVINTQALYFQVLRLVGDKKKALHLRNVVNGDVEAYLKLYDPNLGYYLPWNWKNHSGDREQEEWFDSLGNILAILSGLAKREQAESILKHIEKEKINRPFPCKAIWPPIKPGDKEWHSYFEKCDARIPLDYLNGGVWPFVGGFYIAALVKMNKHEQAEKELIRLAKADLQEMSIRKKRKTHGMNEWLQGATGEPRGEPYQAWTAAMYIYAHECVKQKKAIYFE